MKKKVIICKGLSGSGKSTFSNEYKRNNPNVLIVTKDDIRKTMGVIVGDNSTIVKESKVVEKRNELIIKGLEKGMTIISCDTNLNPIHIKNIKALVFPKYRDLYDVEIKDFTDVPLDVCIERCANRTEGKEFWRKIIMDQKDQWLETPKMEQDRDLEWIVLCDSDGCINHVSKDRSPYDGSLCHLDEPNEIVIDYLRMIKETKGMRIVIMSGLEDKYRTNRENWYIANNVPYDELYMRTAGDSRKDYIIKDELFEKYIKDKYYVYAVIEDRMMMRRHYTNKGLSDRMFSIGNCFKEF